MFAVEKTKRKNDARSRRYLVIGLVTLLILIFAAGLLLLSTFVPPDPAGRLHYSFFLDPTTPAEVAYDFDSDRSESALLPFTPKTSFWNASPDGKWYFYWQEERDPKSQLVIGETDTGSEWIVGQFDKSWTVWSADSRWLTLTSSGESSDGAPLSATDLWRVQPETREVKRLTTNDTDEQTPQLSPNGQYMAYITATEQGNKLYRIDIDTETTQRLLEDKNVNIDSFAWASDSQWLALTVRPAFPTGQAAQLWLFNHITGDITLIKLERQLQTYQWSPHGHWLAYTTTSPVEKAQQLHLFNLDTGADSARRLTSETMGDNYVWSPDGRWLAFLNLMPALPPVPYPYPTTTLGPDALNGYSRAQKEQDRLRMAYLSVWDTRTGTEHHLGADVLWTEIDWSPDSQWIAYLTHQSGTGQQYRYDFGTLSIANPETGRVRPLMPGKIAYAPAWAPDSQWLAFITYDQPLPEHWSAYYPGLSPMPTSIWLIRPDGTDAQVFVSDKESAYRSLLWKP